MPLFDTSITAIQYNQRNIKMQAALTVSPPVLRSAPPTSFTPKLLTRPSAPPTSFIPKLTRPTSRFASIKTDALSVNYNSNTSVFPAEACETIGGDACRADIYPEEKLKPQATVPRIGLEPVEREYLDYTDARTVLLGEACDVLGGEFCEAPYQKGICM